MVAQFSEASIETLTYKQVLRGPDHHNFINFKDHKVHDHKKQVHWTCMQHGDMPENTNIIMRIWSFKHERFPYGTLNKNKARLCAHRGMQTWGNNYWETYTPVVNWAGVCLLLAEVKIHALPLKSMDLVLAFLQADLEVIIYMELPFDFDVPQNGNKKTLCSLIE